MHIDKDKTINRAERLNSAERKYKTEDIKIKNEHTCNNCGMFDIVIDGLTYPAKWEQRGNVKKLETNAPEYIYKRVYNYLFN